MKKAVILCSGGFDSVVLTHYVKNELEYEKGYCLFFNYHQKSYPVEKKWAEEHCKRVGYEFIEINIPKFTWTNGGFYDEYFEDTQHQYLESRNKVFLAFASSVAEAKKCDTIFVGAIGGEGSRDYNDCTPKYFNVETKAIQESTGLPITISAPFCNTCKVDLIGFARKYDILPNEWSSCDYVIDGKIPCGDCGDCESSSDVARLLLGTYINNQISVNVNSLTDNFVFADDLYEVVKESYELNTQPLNKVFIRCSRTNFDEAVRFKKLVRKLPYNVEVIISIHVYDLQWVKRHEEDILLFDEVHLPFELKRNDSDSLLDTLSTACMIKYFSHFTGYDRAVEEIEKAEHYSLEDLILYYEHDFLITKRNKYSVEDILLNINEEVLKHKIRVQVVFTDDKIDKDLTSEKMRKLFSDMILYNFPFPIAFEKTAENLWSTYLSVSKNTYKSV